MIFEPGPVALLDEAGLRAAIGAPLPPIDPTNPGETSRDLLNAAAMIEALHGDASRHADDELDDETDAELDRVYADLVAAADGDDVAGGGDIDRAGHELDSDLEYAYSLVGGERGVDAVPPFVPPPQGPDDDTPPENGGNPPRDV